MGSGCKRRIREMTSSMLSLWQFIRISLSLHFTGQQLGSVLVEKTGP
jgi:hypothetical protein